MAYIQVFTPDARISMIADVRLPSAGATMFVKSSLRQMA
jgi:hypothetical protein